MFRWFIIFAGLCALAVPALWLADQEFLLGLAVIAAWSSIALSLQQKPSLRSFAFTAWVLAFVSAAMFHPLAFRTWGDFELKRLIVPLIQLIMFGMGTTLSLVDFSRVLTMPRAVLVGMVLQFSVMPLTGAALAAAFGFEPAVAAGVVLIGACPGGVASNVMTYLAKGNVALSVTMTACSTLASPIMTPLMMKWLAGQYIEINVPDMMVSILNMIIVPIVAGLVANKILQLLRWRGPWMDRALSVVAMAAICFIIAIITSLSRDKLLTVGLALIAAAVLHNGIGYLLGYWGAALFGLDASTRRTVAIEVGLQNGGMASGLAVNVLNSPNAAMAPAIFGPWMNISGSILASWWRRSNPQGNTATLDPSANP
jgi:BASS family bile acid:Na+ symporter